MHTVLLERGNRLITHTHAHIGGGGAQTWETLAGDEVGGGASLNPS